MLTKNSSMYPRVKQEDANGNVIVWPEAGMTTYQYIATVCLPIAAQHFGAAMTREEIVDEALKLADVLVAELNKRW